MVESSKSTNGNRAIAITDNGTDKSVSDCWFPSIAQTLLGSGGGATLSLLTGFEERSCWRYLNKSGIEKPTQPPGFFIVSLLRSEQGGTWLPAFMDGYEPRWWRELQMAPKRAAAAEQKLREINSILGS